MNRFDIKATPQTVVEASQAEGFSIRCMDAGDGPAELMIMDDIGKDPWGDGIAASDVVSFLSSNKGKPVNVKINSFGGSAYEGLVMYNAFLEHDAEITATIQGIAFSAATMPAMGADKLIMSAQSDFGIHRAWTVAGGNQNQLKGVLEWLASVDNHLLDVYEDKTGASREQIENWMDGTDDGTVFNATEALENGFADEVLPSKSKRQSSKAVSTIANRRRQKIKSRIRSLTK